MSMPPPIDPPPGSPSGYPGYPPATYPYPQYLQPQYPYPQPRTNALAIASLVCALLFAPLGIVFGHLSLSQIRRSGEDGRGLAIAGLVVGYVVTIAAIVAVVAGTLLFAWAARVVRESTDPGGAGIPRYHASAPLTPGPTTHQAALVTR
jgi:peptidyl-prolyl cis-trans isomerase B (cyclophilin B)